MTRPAWASNQYSPITVARQRVAPPRQALSLQSLVYRFLFLLLSLSVTLYCVNFEINITAYDNTS